MPRDLAPIARVPQPVYLLERALPTPRYVRAHAAPRAAACPHPVTGCCLCSRPCVTHTLCDPCRRAVPCVNTVLLCELQTCYCCDVQSPPRPPSWPPGGHSPAAPRSPPLVSTDRPVRTFGLWLRRFSNAFITLGASPRSIHAKCPPTSRCVSPSDPAPASPISAVQRCLVHTTVLPDAPTCRVYGTSASHCCSLATHLRRVRSGACGGPCASSLPPPIPSPPEEESI